MLISGWGRHPTIDAEIVSPNCQSALSAAIQKTRSTQIARGMGRSYGDSALSAHVISTRYLNALLEFAPANGKVRCGAGTMLAELLEFLIPRGWFLPVTPGTKFVTVGGAIASDVHGKNHHTNGCFSEFVDSLRIVLASGDLLTCSRHENSDLFQATCAGMGLTGVIADATLKLMPLRSTDIRQVITKCTNLEETILALDACTGATYSVAWIDCLAKGSHLGRSLLMTGEHAQETRRNPSNDRSIPILVDAPGWILNSHLVSLFNSFYYHRIRAKQSAQNVSYESFFYPLDKLIDWNRLYGKSGFTQYQLVVPKISGLPCMQTILRKISDARCGSFLAVIKALGPENTNYLSFPMAGYTLALDFKLEPGVFELFGELDTVVQDHGGRTYLTKDCHMSVTSFQRSYPRANEFQTVRKKYGAVGKFASLQSQRIGLE